MASRSRLGAAGLLAVFLLASAASRAQAQFVLNNPRFGHSSTLLPNGNILICGGDIGSGVVNIINICEISDEQDGVYDLKATLAVARSSHTATLLPNGLVLVAGGRSNATDVQCSLEVYDPIQNTWTPGVACVNDTTYANPAGTAQLGISRYNHTATLLKNGAVLICGGENDLNVAAAGINSTCDIYTPNGYARPDGTPCGTVAGCVDAAGTMITPRTYHTASLLADGRVYLAGGYNSAGRRYLLNTEFYDPLQQGFHPGPPLLTPRAYHTATAMGNGQIFITGGYNGTNDVTGNRGFQQYSEIFDPTSGSARPASQMLIRNAFHTATLDNDGTIKMFGGLGNLTTTFIANNPTLSPNSGPTSFITCVNGASTADCGNDGVSSNIRQGRLNMRWTFQLPVEVTGGVIDGEVLFSTPSVALTNGSAYFARGKESIPVIAPGVLGSMNGLKLNLNGRRVGCTANGPCGQIDFTFDTDDAPVDSTITSTASTNVDDLTLFGISTTRLPPKYNYLPTAMSGGTLGTGLMGTCVSFTGGDANGVGSHNSPRTIGVNGANCGGTAGSLTGLFQLTNLPLEFASAQTECAALPGWPTPGAVNLRNINLTITGGSLTQNPPGTVSVSLTGGTAFVPGPVQVVVNTAQTGSETIATGFLGTFTLLSGTISNSSATATCNGGANPGCVYSGANVPWTGGGCNGGNCQVNASITARATFVADCVGLSGKTFTVDVATVIIRQMAMGDFYRYTPNTDIWSFEPTIKSYGRQRFGHSAVLTPTGSLRFIGGKSCDNTTLCLALQAKGNTLTDSGFPNANLIPILSGWSGGPSLGSAVRGNHTSTLLPNGFILLAGGTANTSGSVTKTSFALDPIARTITQTASPMNFSRDLHTATLLPNGRVLVAGGFSTDASTRLPSGLYGVPTSSGATYTAEIFYPDTGSWVPTEVMVSSRDQHTATLLPDGNVFVFGGFNRGSYLAIPELYITTAATWIPWGLFDEGGAPLTQCDGESLARANHTATLMSDGRVLIAGGINANGVLSSAFIFNSRTRRFTCTRPLTAANIPAAAGNAGGHPVQLHTATQLSDNRVLLAGGHDGVGESNLSVIYNGNRNVTGACPAAATCPWSVTGNMPAPRFNHTTTLLPNGIVIMAGGATRTQVLRGVETFDVTASSWLATGNLNQARAYHTTTLGRDGFLYAVGGYSGASYLGSSDILYFTASPDAATLGAPPSIRQSTISVINASSGTAFGVGVIASTGSLITLRGINFMGLTEASGGGAASANSSHFHPRVVMQALGASGGTGSQSDGGFRIDVTTAIYDTQFTPPFTLNRWASIVGNNVTQSSITFKVPEGSSVTPTGWYQILESNNAQWSPGAILQVGPPTPFQGVGVVTGTPVSASSVLWTWTTPVTGANGYNIYNSTTGIYLGTSTGSATTSFLLRNMAPNTPISVRVNPYTISGDGPGVVSLPEGPLATSLTPGATVPAGQIGGFITKAGGGTVSGQLVDGRYVTLYVPGLAASNDTLVTIATMTATVAPFNLCPTLIATGIAIYTDPPANLTAPAYLSIGFLPGEFPVGTDLNTVDVTRFDPGTGKCVPFKTTVNTTTNLINSQINHFSNFYVNTLGPSANGPGLAGVFPNPFYPHRDGYMTFINMPAYARIRIFTMRGEMIFDQIANASGLATWDGANTMGRKVASGVYVAVIEAFGREFPRKLMKIAVLR